MRLQTKQFGQIEYNESDVFLIPGGLLGFPKMERFCVIDPGDHVLMLWLQSVDEPHLAFPILEPKVFKPEYRVHLSATELRVIKLRSITDAAVFSLLTIPSEVEQMTANLKAPIVINLKEKIGKQVVLQENEYSIKHPMFKEFRTHIMTIQANGTQEETAPGVMAFGDLHHSDSVKPMVEIKDLGLF